MQNANLEGMIQNPEQEIAQKLDAYFTSNGLKVKAYYDRDSIDGDYGYEIRGTMDDIRVVVSYNDFKPQKKVLREIMALDERISDVDCTRLLSEDEYKHKECEHCLDPIFVMIDGTLMQTNWFEYVNYMSRNIDFTKCK